MVEGVVCALTIETLPNAATNAADKMIFFILDVYIIICYLIQYNTQPCQMGHNMPNTDNQPIKK
ncbi:hypothetical protein GCM10023149_04840 [Mucilaginibacter gynuensis]|uniref:Uncharacterized protein n=1 Tax=Mucilaginibacter gynuensis TaxID=1302236 RepID=A0ABP8FT75_9SPHI